MPATRAAEHQRNADQHDGERIEHRQRAMGARAEQRAVDLMPISASSSAS